MAAPMPRRPPVTSATGRLRERRDRRIGHGSPASAAAVGRDVLTRPQRLGGHGERRIDGSGRGKERGIDDVEIVEVEGLAEGVERRLRGVLAEAHRAALVRRRLLGERPGQHDGEARRTQHPARFGDQRLVRGEVRPPPVEDDGPVTAHPHPALGMRQVLGHGVPVDAVTGEPGAHRARHGTNLGAQHRLHDLAQEL